MSEIRCSICNERTQVRIVDGLKYCDQCLGEEPKTCGTCKHWVSVETELKAKMEAAAEGFGTCGKIGFFCDNETSKDVKRNWLACTLDGSGYFAALKTKESFGCNQWEAKDGARTG